VSFYAEKLLAHHDIPYDCLIAYHDCSPRKPHPDPVLLCLKRLSAMADGSVGIGDSSHDADAYNAAGLTAWGAGWSAALDRDARWSHIAERPVEVMAFFQQR
jgi:phosphoglycolate phosphatase-like HAD superfamily hydrolase